MNRVEFHKPVLVGDVVRFLTRLVRIGRTSITMNVQRRSRARRAGVAGDRGGSRVRRHRSEQPERKPLPLLGDSSRRLYVSRDCGKRKRKEKAFPASVYV